MANGPEHLRRIGVGHDGKPRHLTPADAPDAMIHHPHDAPKIGSAVQATHGYDGGKPPQPKHAHLSHIPVHSGMATKSHRTGITHWGADDMSRYEADPTSPVAGAPAGKRLSAPKIKPGMKSQQSGHLSEDQHFQLGRDLLASATSDGQNPQYGSGKFGALPQNVDEN